MATQTKTTANRKASGRRRRCPTDLARCCGSRTSDPGEQSGRGQRRAISGRIVRRASVFVPEARRVLDRKWIVVAWQTHFGAEDRERPFPFVDEHLA